MITDSTVDLVEILLQNLTLYTRRESFFLMHSFLIGDLVPDFPLPPVSGILLENSIWPLLIWDPELRNNN